MNAAKAASRMRSRTAVSSPPSLSLPRFDIDAVAIALSLARLVPNSTTSLACSAGKSCEVMKLPPSFNILFNVWYPVVPMQGDREGEDYDQAKNSCDRRDR